MRLGCFDILRFDTKLVKRKQNLAGNSMKSFFFSNTSWDFLVYKLEIKKKQLLIENERITK